eukprot:scaffold6685_cov202-Prasinococcus_capsulatus_cf.AAC.15
MRSCNQVLPAQKFGDSELLNFRGIDDSQAINGFDEVLAQTQRGEGMNTILVLVVRLCDRVAVRRVAPLRTADPAVRRSSGHRSATPCRADVTSRRVQGACAIRPTQRTRCADEAGNCMAARLRLPRDYIPAAAPGTQRNYYPARSPNLPAT